MHLPNLYGLPMRASSRPPFRVILTAASFPSRRRVELGFLTFPFPSVATRPGGLSHCYGEFNVPNGSRLFCTGPTNHQSALFLSWHQSVLNRNSTTRGFVFPSMQVFMIGDVKGELDEFIEGA